MSLRELDTCWAATSDDLNYLRWELLACDEIHGVFPTTQADVLIVLFDGGRTDFKGDRPDLDGWCGLLTKAGFSAWPIRHLGDTGRTAS